MILIGINYTLVVNRINTDCEKWHSLTNQFFMKGQPNRYGDIEDCGAFNTRNGLWEDNSCSRSIGFICKKLGNFFFLTYSILSAVEH